MTKHLLKKIFSSPITRIMCALITIVISMLLFKQINLTDESDIGTCLIGFLLLLVDVVCTMFISFTAIYWSDKK